MQDKIPSRTAYRVALQRAAHQLLDSPKVLDDQLAVRLVSEAAEEIRTGRGRLGSRLGKGLRAFLVARSRFAEEMLAQAIVNGVEQYLILGAGLDTSPYRGIAAKTGIRVFEVDHPATQAWKKEKLLKAGIAIPDYVRHVPVDFEKQNLTAELASAGFLATQKTFASWLGVVPYLTREAASNTLRFLASFPPASGVVFDYAVTISSLSWLERIAVKALARRVARAGEPFRLYFEPQELEQFLQGHGFTRIEQLASPQINDRYFNSRDDGLRVMGNAGRIVAAWT